MKLICLHGFLGEPADFSALKVPEADLIAPDYISTTKEPKAWAKDFNQEIERKFPKEEKVLLGYSMGGRMALEAVRENPNLWSGLVLISANPGIEDQEKAARLANDQAWAKRFLEQDFQSVVAEWNRQAVFTGSKNEPLRSENYLTKSQWAQCLEEWSVANQNSFQKFMLQTQIPVLYLSGEFDEKYQQIGRGLEDSNPALVHKVIPNSGHRIIFDNPTDLGDQISSWLKRHHQARSL